MSNSAAGSNAADHTPRKRAKHRNSRVRFAPAALIGGVAASAVIALSMSGTLAGFVASITNANDTAATGSLTMKETLLNADGTTPATPVVCNSNNTASTADNTLNTYSCTTINKYGGQTAMVPGDSVTTKVSITNTGNVTAKGFTLLAGTCASTAYTTTGAVSGNGDLCTKLTATITYGAGATPAAVASGTLASLNAQTYNLATLTGGPGQLAKGASAQFNITINFPSTANDNAFQGLQAKQDLTFSFTS